MNVCEIANMALHMHLVGSSPCSKISLLSVAYPVVGKPFLVLEVHRAIRLAQDPSREEKGWKCLVLYSMIFGLETQVFIIYGTKMLYLIFNLILYN